MNARSASPGQCPGLERDIHRIKISPLSGPKPDGALRHEVAGRTREPLRPGP
ncbi:hypothetical protein [Azospirillum argentinense]